MRRALLAIVCGAIGIGCASSAEIRANAYDHLAKAQALEASGYHYDAARERAAADKQFAKARRRAYDEASVGVYRY